MNYRAYVTVTPNYFILAIVILKPDTFAADVLYSIMVTHFYILLIENCPGDSELLRLALTQLGFDVARYTDGLFSLSR